MNTMYMWALIAFAGALLYIWPVLSARIVVRKMYEGFDALTPAIPQQDVSRTLADMKRILDQGLRTPDLSTLSSLNPPTAELPKLETSGMKASPEAYSTTKSAPGSIYEAPKKSDGLKQGASFQATILKPTPVPPVEPTVIVKKEYVQVPQRCPTQKCPTPKCPTPKCPNAVCPDMRDFIRKDSIPCWACKLS